MWLTLLSAPLLPDKHVAFIEHRCMRLPKPINTAALMVFYACFFVGLFVLLL